MKTVGETIEELYLTRVVTPILSPNTEGDVLREAKPRRIAVSIDLVWDGLGRAGRLGLMGLLFAILVFNTGTKLYAQTGQGTIKGRVTDSTGSVVAGAKVSVISNDTKVILSTSTNNDGLYVVQALNPGDYIVTVTAPGYDKNQVSDVIVRAAQTSTVDTTLKIGTSSETVEVRADATMISDTPEVSATISQKLVENLPVPERNAMGAILLVPGVTGDPTAAGGVFSENAQVTTG